MKIGVSGASGHLGRAVVSELLQRAGGPELVAITRTPETVSGPARGRFGDFNPPANHSEGRAGLHPLLISAAHEARERAAPQRTHIAARAKRRRQHRVVI